MKPLFVFLLLFAVRLSSVFIVKTFYVPDEYWQSLEVAHKLAFGYGYLTWEWVQGIRSYVYPIIIAGIYKLLALLGLDSAQLVILLPRIFQATLSAYSDYRFYKWCGGKKWSLFSIIVPWFWFYTGSRTLSNTLETSLTTIALSYFPWNSEKTVRYLWPATLCCFLRPTAALIWFPLMVYHLRKSEISWTKLIFQRFLVIGLIVAATCIGIDSWMHGSIIITPYEFFKFNVYNNIGSFYGSHPWYWYFTIGLPCVLGVNSVPFMFAIMETVRNIEKYPTRKYLLITILFTLCAMSTVEHKEFRFISALLPLCLYITADFLNKFSISASKLSLWLIAIIILLFNALPAWYLSTVHQKGPLEVMDKLRIIAREYRDDQNKSASIYFFMPCHSTPYYSHIHQNVTMRFLTCEPNLKQQHDYKDEAENFYRLPAHWVYSHIPVHPITAKPTHIVMYDNLEEPLDQFLTEYKKLYKIVNKELNYPVPRLNEWFFNFKPLPEKGENILIFQRLSNSDKGEDVRYIDGKLISTKPNVYIQKD